jgi:DNA-binding MarR family transcriptional regulator
MTIMKFVDLFSRMWSTWQSQIPKPFADENPQILIQLLRIADIKGGISQSELQSALGVNQPRLSKLADKLLEHQWIQIVPKPEGDRRMRFVRTTSKARRAMQLVEAALFTTLDVRPAAPARRRGIAIMPGQMSISSLMEL